MEQHDSSIPRSFDHNTQPGGISEFPSHDEEKLKKVYAELKDKDEYMVQRRSLQTNGWLTLSGIFSAIVASFILFGRPYLERDNTETAAQILRRISLQLEHTCAPSPAAPAIPALPPTAFTPSPALVAAGALLGLSLSLLLAATWISGLLLPLHSARVDWLDVSPPSAALAARQRAVHRYKRAEVMLECVRAMVCLGSYLFGIAMVAWTWTVNTTIAVSVTVSVAVIAAFFGAWDVQSFTANEANTSMMIVLRAWRAFRRRSRAHSPSQPSPYTQLLAQVCDILGFRTPAVAARHLRSATELVLPFDSGYSVEQPLPVDSLSRLHASAHYLLVNHLLRVLVLITTDAHWPVDAHAQPLKDALTCDTIVRILLQLSYYWKDPDRESLVHTCIRAFVRILDHLPHCQVGTRPLSPVAQRAHRTVAHILETYARSMIPWHRALRTELIELFVALFQTLPPSSDPRASDHTNITAHVFLASRHVQSNTHSYGIHAIERALDAFNRRTLPDEPFCRLLADLAETVIEAALSTPQIVSAHFVESFIDFCGVQCDGQDLQLRLRWLRARFNLPERGWLPANMPPQDAISEIDTPSISS